MKIAVWKTGHEIADRIADAIYSSGSPETLVLRHTSNITEISDFDAHIGYGILRGVAEVFHAATAANRPWFCADRGYWKPGHYNGFYRISLNGTQQTTGLDKLEPDYKRWERLGLEILPEKNGGDYVLACPITDPVKEFFKPKEYQPIAFAGEKVVFRKKTNTEPLQKDLDGCFRVGTFNSSVGWEALRQGIPCISDETHSFVGAYQKQFDISPHLNVDSRRRMFAVQAGLQLQLNEIRSGLLWPLIQKLLSTSATTAEKQSLQMFSQAQ